MRGNGGVSSSVIYPAFQLAGTPSRDVVLQALGGLLNLTVTETLREEVGKRGAIEVAMSECRQIGVEL